MGRILTNQLQVSIRIKPIILQGFIIIVCFEIFLRGWDDQKKFCEIIFPPKTEWIFEVPFFILEMLVSLLVNRLIRRHVRDRQNKLKRTRSEI